MKAASDGDEQEAFREAERAERTSKCALQDSGKEVTSTAYQQNVLLTRLWHLRS